ncbi:MAG: HAMP domain-containing sensor histidine kinase [Cyclobacteriaceae bacterium]
MKLINQFTIWYLGISIIVLLIGGILIFKKLESEIDFEQGQELERQLDRYARKMESLKNPEELEKDRLEIIELPLEKALIPFNVRDTLAWHEPLEQVERQVKAGRSFLINGRHFYMSTYNIMIESSDITETVVQTMVAIFVLLLVFITITGRIISKKILRPFHHSLDQIRTFSFQKNTPLKFESTKTEEFIKLNDFLHKMSLQLLHDFRIVKEFSENISHEIQTPVAVIRGKLELLMNSPISDQQAQLIEAAYLSNERLTRIVSSLSLLAKLENQEFEFSEKINFSALMNQTLEEFDELIKIKNLSLELRIASQVNISMHPNLAEMLLHNLLTNAIRHNIHPGMIDIELDSKRLIIKNPGPDPENEVSVFLERFKKGKKNSDSIGLGLSIVQQICWIHGYVFDYSFETPIHRVEVRFN